MKPKPFKLPNFVRITHRVKYRVRFVEGFPDDPTQVGECDFEHKVISIKRKQRPTRIQETLWHEIGHALIRENKIEVDVDLEEYIIKRCEKPLARIIRLNGLRFK